MWNLVCARFQRSFISIFHFLTVHVNCIDFIFLILNCYRVGYNVAYNLLYYSSFCRKAVLVKACWYASHTVLWFNEFEAIPYYDHLNQNLAIEEKETYIHGVRCQNVHQNVCQTWCWLLLALPFLTVGGGDRVCQTWCWSLLASPFFIVEGGDCVHWLWKRKGMGRVAFLKKKGKNRWSWLNKH
jgi:hypothetical protein